MKYQLVVQFPENTNYDLGWLIEIEDKLIEILRDSEVDGHDIGSREMNIFILTDTPIKTFETVKNILKNYDSALEDIKIAYRDINDEQFCCLWPTELTEFQVA